MGVHEQERSVNRRRSGNDWLLLESLFELLSRRRREGMGPETHVTPMQMRSLHPFKGVPIFPGGVN
jgi:hypothetical protein